MLVLLHVKSMATFLRIVFLIDRPWAIKDYQSPFH